MNDYAEVAWKDNGWVLEMLAVIRNAHGHSISLARAPIRGTCTTSNPSSSPSGVPAKRRTQTMAEKTPSRDRGGERHRQEFYLTYSRSDAARYWGCPDIPLHGGGTGRPGGSHGLADDRQDACGIGTRGKGRLVNRQGVLPPAVLERL